MGTQHYCETCAKVCDEAKKTIKKLEKRIQTLTIVCVASVTLLGEQGAKALYDVIQNFNKVTEVANNGQKEGKEKDTNKKDEQNKLGSNKIGFEGWNRYRPKNNNNNPEKDSRNYQPGDELALIKKQTKQQKETEIAIASAPPLNIPFTTNLDITPLTIQRTPYLPFPADPYAAFLTPSTLPFDVYSTTLGLGYNYGFGEYYGMGSGSWVPSTPDASTMSVFAIGSLFNTRRRA